RERRRAGHGELAVFRQDARAGAGPGGPAGVAGRARARRSDGRAGGDRGRGRLARLRAVPLRGGQRAHRRRRYVHLGSLTTTGETMSGNNTEPVARFQVIAEYRLREGTEEVVLGHIARLAAASRTRPADLSY